MYDVCVSIIIPFEIRSYVFQLLRNIIFQVVDQYRDFSPDTVVREAVAIVL